MQSKESNKFQKLLRGSSFVTGNIIFDDDEIFIQRDAKAFWYSIFIIIFFSFGPAIRIFEGSYSTDKSMIIHDLLLSIIIIILLTISVLKLIEIRKTSNIAFPIKDLKSISIITRKKLYIRIYIQLNDSRKTSVTVHNDTYFRDFIDTIKRHNVEIK